MNHIEQLLSGELAGTQRLKLACGLTEFPTEIYSLAETLEILDLSGNQLSTLPDDLPRLKKLRIIFCSDNQFTELPEVLGCCPQLSMVGFKANRIHTVSAASLPAKLRWLILTDNQIEALPAELGQCSQLQKLMLAGNRLSALPETLVNCSRLELLRIAANQLTELPLWLLSMPRLTWLAYAGNPFTEAQEAQAHNELLVNPVTWNDLSVGKQLGEGASGIIHHAQHRMHDGPLDVAVKLFKGDVTSDGLPSSEMAACLSAGRHPNLITAQGKVVDHPDGKHGLVMALIDRQFTNLAGAPSLESCTRDVYPPNTLFKPQAALTIARSIASAARHLHENGIMHGDLYAHNILHAAQGHALIGDFGAASFHPGDEIDHAHALERLEVRAFGCLLEELLTHIDQNQCTDFFQAQLSTLKAACLSDTPSKRPLFADIEQRLAEISAIEAL